MGYEKKQQTKKSIDNSILTVLYYCGTLLASVGIVYPPPHDDNNGAAHTKISANPGVSATYRTKKNKAATYLCLQTVRRKNTRILRDGVWYVIQYLGSDFLSNELFVVVLPQLFRHLVSRLHAGEQNVAKEDTEDERTVRGTENERCKENVAMLLFPVWAENTFYTHTHTSNQKGVCARGRGGGGGPYFQQHPAGLHETCWHTP